MKTKKNTMHPTAPRRRRTPLNRPQPGPFTRRQPAPRHDLLVLSYYPGGPALQPGDGEPTAA